MALVCVIAIAMSFTACGKFECDLCGEEKSGRKYEGAFGTENCKDCYDELKELENGLKGLENAFK